MKFVTAMAEYPLPVETFANIKKPHPNPSPKERELDWGFQNFRTHNIFLRIIFYIFNLPLGNTSTSLSAE
jgi:hypothetical protein